MCEDVAEHYGDQSLPKTPSIHTVSQGMHMWAGQHCRKQFLSPVVKSTWCWYFYMLQLIQILFFFSSLLKIYNVYRISHLNFSFTKTFNCSEYCVKLFNVTYFKTLFR